MIQQTSLQFFAMSLYEAGLLTGSGDMIQNLLDQAREMYQEEIDQSYRDGYEFCLINDCAKQSTSEAHDKEVHRQQIIAAYKAAMHTQYLESHTVTRYGTIHKADDYYIKTYGDGIQ